MITKTLILDFLEETAARVPEKTAFLDPQGEITYTDLVKKARAVGSALHKYVSPRNVVGFYLDKSCDAVVGFLGAVYAGCGYAQLNLRHPASRILSILESLRSGVVVTDRTHAEALSGMGISDRILILEDLMETEADLSALSRIRSSMIDLDPLYVNFTSGSTGSPKGVVVCHRNVIDFIPVFVDTFGIREDDVLANQAPFDFDVSVKDIYSGLFTGATVAIIPTPYFTQPTVLMDYLCSSKVTILIWAVSALCFLTTMNALAYRTPDTIRMIMFSGEIMPVKHLRKLQKYLPETVYVNLYGPTEITCNCTYYVLDREFQDHESIPIGIPFRNERVFLLDEQDHAVTEPGSVGELCVSGSSVALGYWRDPERTNAVFTQNPLNHDIYERIYRTGDLVRICENGDWVYVSRKDFQVKHMGHRIELGEIETRLTATEGVERALVTYLHEKGRILAFLCGTAPKEAIVEALRVDLPEYMIPNLFFYVEQMPLTKNGKIDRAALMELYAQQKGASRG